MKHELKNIYQRAQKKYQFSARHEIDSMRYQKKYQNIANKERNYVREQSVECAVVIHLYYTESWGFFLKKLALLAHTSFDLYISLPVHNEEFTDVIRESFPNAHIAITPNRGRDVLPFLMLAKILYQKGYVYVLKIHSKKSIHRTDGDEWLASMINSLIPSEKKSLDAIISRLRETDTGVIGPEGQYVSLTVNFEANGAHMTRIITSLYSKKVSYDVLQLTRTEWGFFAGTMFWMRLDSIDKIITARTALRLFESEKGQIDATRAHALERLFGIIPEIEKRTMYEIRNGVPTVIDYKSGNIPDWSDVYIGPKENE